MAADTRRALALAAALRRKHADLTALRPPPRSSSPTAIVLCSDTDADNSDDDDDCRIVGAAAVAKSPQRRGKRSAKERPSVAAARSASPPPSLCGDAEGARGCSRDTAAAERPQTLRLLQVEERDGTMRRPQPQPESGRLVKDGRQPSPGGGAAAASVPSAERGRPRMMHTPGMPAATATATAATTKAPAPKAPASARPTGAVPPPRGTATQPTAPAMPPAGAFAAAAMAADAERGECPMCGERMPLPMLTVHVNVAHFDSPSSAPAARHKRGPAPAAGAASAAALAQAATPAMDAYTDIAGDGVAQTPPPPTAALAQEPEAGAPMTDRLVEALRRQPPGDWRAFVARYVPWPPKWPRLTAVA